MPADCKAWKDLGINKNGVYPIKPDNGAAFQVTELYFVVLFLLVIIAGLL